MENATIEALTARPVRNIDNLEQQLWDRSSFDVRKFWSAAICHRFGLPLEYKITEAFSRAVITARVLLNPPAITARY